MALKSEQVLELMAEDYSSKYLEYMAVVEQRQTQEALRQKILESRRLAHREVRTYTYTYVHVHTCPRAVLTTAFDCPDILKVFFGKCALVNEDKHTFN